MDIGARVKDGSSYERCVWFGNKISEHKEVTIKNALF